MSRLRLEVKNPELVNEKPIKAAGIAGLMRPEKTKVQLHYRQQGTTCF